jgi:hypothetical protein
MMDMGSLSAQAIPVAPVHKVVHVGDLHNILLWRGWRGGVRPTVLGTVEMPEHLLWTARRDNIIAHFSQVVLLEKRADNADAVSQNGLKPESLAQ